MGLRNFILYAALGAAAGALAAMPAAAAPITYAVSVDTSSISTQTGWIDIQFNPGGLSQSAFVTIAGFATDGTLAAGTEIVTGDVSGVLPGTLTITNSTAFNDYFQQMVFGSTITFELAFDGPALATPDGVSTAASAFALAFYDDTQVNPLLSADPQGFAAIIDVNLDGTTTVTTAPATIGGLSAVTITAVPEPAGLPVLLAGLAGLLAGTARPRMRAQQRACA